MATRRECDQNQIVTAMAHLAAAPRAPEDRWRVAAQIVDGFAQLNDNAATLFGAPAEGLRT